MECAQQQFESILAGLDPNLRPEYCRWVRQRIAEEKKEKGTDRVKNGAPSNSARKQLRRIARRLRELTPLEHGLDIKDGPSNGTNPLEEQINKGDDDELVWPAAGPFADCKPHSTLHVDAFLYDDDDLEGLARDGLVRRHFCGQCGSTDVQQVQLISHSLGIDELHHLFTVLLPSLDIHLDGKTLVDLGSRLGAVLYAAALYCPRIGRIVGIERLHEFDSLQRQICAEFCLAPPVELCCADFRRRADLLAGADVLVMHNVFTFFADEAEQVDCWNHLRNLLRPGMLLLHSPSVHSVTAHLLLEFRVDEWLETLHSIPDDCLEASDDSICVYRVRS